jgi:hypothetical protein
MPMSSVPEKAKLAETSTFQKPRKRPQLPLMPPLGAPSAAGSQRNCAMGPGTRQYLPPMNSPLGPPPRSMTSIVMIKMVMATGARQTRVRRATCRDTH